MKERRWERTSPNPTRAPNLQDHRRVADAASDVPPRRVAQPQERSFRDIGGDERIPVAIAPHPRAEVEEWRNVERLTGIADGQAVAERGMHLWHRLPQPRHDRQAAFHLVEHGRPRGPEKLRLPEHVEFAVQVALVHRPFAGQEVAAVEFL
jgi:hypothetical protein